MKFITFVVVCSILFQSVLMAEKERQISCDIFSSSNDSTSFSVIYVKASGNEDIIHYLWSTYKLPSIIVAKTTNDTELKLDLQELKSFSKNAIQFTKKPLTIIGLSISEVFQLTYASDSATISEISSAEALNLEDFEWSFISNDTLNCSDEFASAVFDSFSKNQIFAKRGNFRVQFSVASKESSANNFPHLIYNGNSSQLQIALDNFFTNNSRIRYSMELIMHSSFPVTCPKRECNIEKEKSLSDEFSPGIFMDIDAFPPCQPRLSFFTWRPVVYNSREPSIANSSDAHITSQCLEFVGPLSQSIAELYFSNQPVSLNNAFNMTFGTKGDGFYAKTKYNTWSLMVGIGKPLHNKVSVTALIWICGGLIALGVFFFSGAVFFAFKTCAKQRKDDEASLLSNSVQ